MESYARRFLKRMCKNNGFLAEGLYECDTSPRFWHSNNKYSARMIDLSLFNYLRKNRLIIQDKSGKYIISNKGRKFIRPWYIRWFEFS